MNPRQSKKEPLKVWEVVGMKIRMRVGAEERCCGQGGGQGVAGGQPHKPGFISELRDRQTRRETEGWGEETLPPRLVPGLHVPALAPTDGAAGGATPLLPAPDSALFRARIIRFTLIIGL